MAKDITIKNPQGTVTYYPKTVSQLVYDNNNGKTVATEISELNNGLEDTNTYVKYTRCLFSPWLESPYNSAHSAGYRFITNSSFTNSDYVGKTVLGLYINMNTAGSITIIKGTGITNGSTDYTITEYETFAVKAGLNRLYFQTPLVINDGEYFGIHNTSGKINGRASTTNPPVKMKYVNTGVTPNKIATSATPLCVGILLDGTIDDRVTKLENESATKSDIEEIKEDIYPLFYESACESPFYDTATAVTTANVYRFPTDGSYTNLPYRNRKVIGFKVKLETAGTVTIALGTNIQNNRTDYTVTDIQSFSGVAGNNEFFLDEPIVVTDAPTKIGFKTTSKPIQKVSASSTVRYDYISDGEVSTSTSCLSFGFILENNLPERVGNLDTNVSTLNDEVDALQESVSVIEPNVEDLQEKVDNLYYREVLKSPYLENPNATTANGIYRFPTDDLYSNAAYRNQTIVGLKVNVNATGTLTIVKGVNAYRTSTEYSIVDIQSFDVVAGMNTLILDTPIVIDSENDRLGYICTSYVRQKTTSTPESVRYLYIDSETNKVNSTGSILCCSIILADSVRDSLEEIKPQVIQNTENIASLTASVDGISSQLTTEVLTSPYLETPNSVDKSYPQYRFFVGGNGGKDAYTNASYKGKKVMGVKAYVGRVGNLVFIKGRNIKKNATLNGENNNFTVEEIETFEVTTAGLKTFTFTTPVTFEEDYECIGVYERNSTDALISCRTVYPTDGSGKNSNFYYNASTDKLLQSHKPFCISLICFAISDESIDYGEQINEINKELKLIHQDILDTPYFYHWNPNGFINHFIGDVRGIPSQSIEDNFLAKRFGFKFVEANVAVTSDGKYIITHGASGKFGAEFTDEYKDVAMDSMTYDDIVANVMYNSSYACYQHHVSTAEEFFKNCYQLGLGVTLRKNNTSLIKLAQTYLPDSRICIHGKASLRSFFSGILATYIGGTESMSDEYMASICNVDYLRDTANGLGGAPFYVCLYGRFIKYMLDNDIIDDVIGTLRQEGIYIGAAYASHDICDKLVAHGGWGIAAQIWQCNTFGDANLGAWSSMDADKTGWSIPSGVEFVGGRLENNTQSIITIQTPSTGVLQFGKGNLQARFKGTVATTFGIGSSAFTFTDCDEYTPIACARGGSGRDMRLQLVIYPNSSIEYMSYQVSRV